MELASLKAKQQGERKGTNLMEMTEAQLFQVGMLEASAFYERRQEQEQFGIDSDMGAVEPRQSLLELLIDLAFSAEGLAINRARLPLDEEDLVVRYIKHLVQVTVSRNAYQVMIGISQFLYHHGPKQMERIHLHIDPNRNRGGLSGKAYKDSRRRIWNEMVNRFGGLSGGQSGGLLAIRGKRRFQIQARTLPLFALVNECLNHLALWDAECNKFSDEPHQAHALIHPACYDKIIKQLPIKNPTANLIIPQFVLPANNNNHPPRPDRRQPPDLTAEQLRQLQEICDKLGRRRKESEPVLLLVVADGVERARFDPRTGETAACRLKADSRIIEVYSREADGDLLLASCWLAELAGGGEERVIAEHSAEGGQVVRFDIAFSEEGEAAVTISYRETKPIRWLALEWRRLVYRFRELSFKPKPLTAWAMAGAAALALLFTLWVWRQKPNELPEIVKQASPTVEPSPVVLPSPTVELPLIAENRPKPQTGKDR
ncbi:MAG: hypothetical protein AAB401_10690, partial [Acidobacteriota bacterium]